MSNLAMNQHNDLLVLPIWLELILCPFYRWSQLIRFNSYGLISFPSFAILPFFASQLFFDVI
jgi:hypothetical protein